MTTQSEDVTHPCDGEQIDCIVDHSHGFCLTHDPVPAASPASEDVDLMPLRVALNHASGIEPAKVHKFQRLLDRVDAALASRAPSDTLVEALQSYSCGKDCSYRKGKFLIEGRCPRDFEGSCGKRAYDALAALKDTQQAEDRESDREALLRIAAVASFGVRLSRREIAALKRIAEGM